MVEAIRISSLQKRYGSLHALERVDLDVARGEAFGLVGANGAGKTTLIKCLLDLVSPDAGAIEIFGVPAQRAASRPRPLKPARRPPCTPPSPPPRPPTSRPA